MSNKVLTINNITSNCIYLIVIIFDSDQSQYNYYEVTVQIRCIDYIKHIETFKKYCKFYKLPNMTHPNLICKSAKTVKGEKLTTNYFVLENYKSFFI